ncbi:MAG: hypothetical protein N2Z57_03260 [Oscillospiraceae bacterium]|nr:hypothetical protein [Oscillospiraceae bacterium]
MEDYLKKIVADAEFRAENFIMNQILDSGSKEFGGFAKDMDIVQPKTTIYGVTTLISLYNFKSSRFYLNDEVFKRINIALDYIVRFQREDGTFDYLSCNFYSAPDTAFCVKRLLPSFFYLQKHLDIPENEGFLEKITAIIERAADGIAKGGFHTPNHRWAIASVLMACANIFGKEEYRQKANLYLNEGIDCNEYGEYSERSSGNYNRINDEAMIILYEQTGETKYLDYAKRNLEMMFYYFEPDGSIFTKNSTRYDKSRKFYPRDYYFDYLYVGFLQKNNQFLSAAAKIMEDVIKRGDLAPDCLNLLLNHEELINLLKSDADFSPAFPDRYSFFNPDSGIFRVRKDKFSYSVLAKNPYFLYFQVGELSIGACLNINFFEHHEFIPEKIERMSSGVKVYSKFKGWFYCPFNEKPQETDWWKMDHDKRGKIDGPVLDIDAEIKETEDGIDLHLSIDGCDRIPFAIEFSVDSNDFLIKTQSFIHKPVLGSMLVIKEGYAEISKGCSIMKIGPSFGEHFFVQSGNNGNSSFYFTGFTNFKNVISFRMVSQRFKNESDSLH